MKIYLAAQFGEPNSEKRHNVEKASQILKVKGFEVFEPWGYRIPNAWDYPNSEWGLMVFMNDVKALDSADMVVALTYGRESTAGSNWEMGYAFAKEKKIILVEMTDNIMSVMVANGRYATVKGLDELKNYDFDKMPKTRSNTEQK